MKTIGSKRKLSLGTWISIGHPVLTEIAVGAGFDWLLFDMEHGYATVDKILPNILAARGTDVKIIVRTGGFDPAVMCRVLDWGAAGIMVPHVDDVKLAREVVESMNYPPYGRRGFSGSARCFGYGTSTPASTAEHPRPYFIAQVESYEAVHNAREIAALDGVDALFVGPRDLKLELSEISREEPLAFDEAVRIVGEACSVAGKQAGILLEDNSDLPLLRCLGYSLFAKGSEPGILKAGYKKITDELK